jgi:hypothetical protein
MPVYKSMIVTLAGLIFIIWSSEPAFPGIYNSIRCGTRLIDVGASRYEVLQKCGQPDDIVTNNIFTVRHNRIIDPSSGLSGGYIYDYFITTISSDGQNVRHADYCDDHGQILELYQNHSGAYNLKSSKFTSISRYLVTPSYNAAEEPFIWRCTHETIKVEKYIYNLGSTKLLRFMTFHNGNLVKIETGEFGF